MTNEKSIWEFSGITAKRINPEEKQIILRLTGNLGNHLWQLAYAYHLKDQFKFDEILLDIRNCEGRMEQLELLKFRLPEYIYIMDSDTEFILEFDQLRSAYEAFKKSVFQIKNCIIDSFLWELYERGFVFAEQSVPVAWKLSSNTLFVSGFFQRIDNISNTLRSFINECLVPDERYFSKAYNSCIGKLIDHKDMVAVSVRCGKDYRKLSWDYCRHEYFHQALEDELVSRKFVFCDDLESTKSILGDDESYIWDSSLLSPFEQLNLMRHFNKYIISNSTFSYWGALASYDQNPKIVFPDKWFPHMDTIEAGILFGNYEIIKC